ncbi:MAG: hypothetical protein J1F63_00795 [Oscillospiraceae bacterium]|nr:hypothetical protein [Oscillospiraceae bacterium]
MYAVFLCLALVIFPDAALRGAGLGLDICLRAVVPSLLPFMLLSSIAVESGWGLKLGRLLSPMLGPMLGIDSAGAMCLMTGLIGGYPCGARTVASAVDGGLMTKSSGEKALAFCNNSGPLFIIGTAGANVYGSTRIGLMLYLCHCIGAVAAALVFGRGSRGSGTAPVRVRPPGAGVLFGRAARESGAAIVSVCALIITFSAIIEALRLSRFPLMVGLIEVSRGVQELGRFGSAALPLSAAYLSWGGLSVHFQTEAVAPDLSKRYYYIGKIISSAMAGLACIVMQRCGII